MSLHNADAASSQFTTGTGFVVSGFQAGNDSATQPSHREDFVDRRRANSRSLGSNERRQFGSSYQGLSEDGRELALAIDQYKMEHHRRYITCDEMLMVINSLGYSKPASE
ncbi:hypothetical protein SV7mr_09880 [Stieleria bergensis]|uniref:Uncharacterized protein n=1 Tax=Stieleria bergensis TaxID=2528025 RepID=A0A517SQT3_9BACT|nr:hypothetical protein SV7mr_09880 [Planctomycetes bacterium SV_7m_r]